jgi:hypothetical protein
MLDFRMTARYRCRGFCFDGPDLLFAMALDFDHLLGPHTGKRTDYLSFCEIDPLVAAALGAMTQTVLLSAHTIHKQLKHHKELPISTYRIMRPCLSFGEYRQDTDRAHEPILSRLHQGDRCG